MSDIAPTAKTIRNTVCLFTFQSFPGLKVNGRIGGGTCRPRRAGLPCLPAKAAPIVTQFPRESQLPKARRGRPTKQRARQPRKLGTGRPCFAEPVHAHLVSHGGRIEVCFPISWRLRA